jgi:hypothetical protein
LSDVTNPYRPPDAAVSSRPPAPARTPTVWYWYVVYCVFMALLYGGLAAGVTVMLVMAPASELATGEAVIMAVLLGGVGLVFLVPYAAAPLLPKRPWTWILGIVLIGLGLTSCLTMPFSIPLLLFWFKPENQAFFGKPVKEQLPPG